MSMENHVMQVPVVNTKFMKNNVMSVPIYHNIRLFDKINNVRPECLAWRRPVIPGYVAMNCDGSYRATSSTGGYDIIIRDYFGKLIEARANHFHQKAKLIILDESIIEVKYETIVLMIELRAILQGLRLAKKLKFTYVEIQSDSWVAISIVVGQAKCPSECHDIYHNILFEITFFKGLGFIFIYRERNGAADFLSKFLIRDGEDYFRTSSSLPSRLQEIIAKDALGIPTKMLGFTNFTCKKSLGINKKAIVNKKTCY